MKTVLPQQSVRPCMSAALVWMQPRQFSSDSLLRVCSNVYPFRSLSGVALNGMRHI
jgi:hypothetical protein